VDDWTAPGAYDVAPGVFRIPLPLPNDGLRAVNVYVVETDDGLVLVDAGWALQESRHLLSDGLKEIGGHLGDIRRFLVTHVHRDHYTQAVAIRRDFGSQVSLGTGERATLELVQQPGTGALTHQMTVLRRNGAAQLAATIEEFARAGVDAADDDRSDWDDPDDWLTPGPLPLAGGRLLDVVETPGHTTGHVVFHDLEASLLFAGDHVLPTITPSIGFEPIETKDPLGAFLRSLSLVRSRPDALLLPAHGPVAPSVHARVDELIAHHGTRLDQVLAAMAGGATTAAEIAGILTWTRRERKLADLDPFNSMLAISETGAHLELLVAQGRASVTDDDGVLRYS